jgi:hypothetical protein
VSYASPIIDLQTASRISIGLLYAWPVAVTVTVAAIRWRQLESRAAFLILGYLTCLGIGALVRDFGSIIYLVHIAPKTVEDRILVAFVNASLTITALGTVLSVGPVWWLSRLLVRNRASAAT